MANSTNTIQIFQKSILIETIIKFSNYSHSTCVNQFDVENDMFVLKSQGPGEVSIFLIFNNYLNFKFLLLGNNIPENHQ